MFKEKLSLVPMLPGCYLMKDKNNNIIYVGKAKKLKNRLKSYFNRTHTGKTLSLVSNISDFEYIVTNNEVESLILEINLIKKYNPKYNILLKDDKTYPYIEITNDKYPILKIIRSKRIKDNKNKLFGPYPSVTSARKTVELINRIFPLRKCNHLKKDYCLYYHIGECLGYCKNSIDKNIIKEMTNNITKLLNGSDLSIIKNLEQKMNKYSENLEFEKALETKKLIDDINKTLNKQIVDSNHKYNFDIFGYYYNDGYLSIQTLFIRNGRIFERHYKIISDILDIEDILTRYIINFYQRFELPKEIIIPSILDELLLEEYFHIKVVIPKRGDIKKLLDMACNNAKILLEEKIETIKSDDKKRAKAIEELKALLKIDSLDRIELFDNSHLFGSYYVGAMVVFRNFVKDSKEYRKYKITLEHPDDLKAMNEVIYRRYYKVLLEDLEKPNLIIVDGGETQVKVVRDIIEELHLNIPIMGLKKDNNHHTKYIINSDLEEVLIPKNSDLFIYLNQMQEEVHRFAISYHRDIYSKGSLSSLLDNISGIGEKRKKELLKKYKSLTKIKEADIIELEKILPTKVAHDLKQYLEGEVSNEE